MGSREPQVMDHEYDGIREYDNPTPGWWHLIFIATIFYALLYYAFYEFSPAATSIWQAHEKAKVRDNVKKFGKLGEMKPDEASILRMMSDQEMLGVAKGTFDSVCAACHNKDGGAANNAGVNLTDDNYKNVKALEDIFKVISKGAANGAMPAQESRLSSNERIILAAYVANLRGQKVANGKAPEGEVIAPWPKASEAPPK